MRQNWGLVRQIDRSAFQIAISSKDEPEVRRKGAKNTDASIENENLKMRDDEIRPTGSKTDVETRRPKSGK